MTITKFLIIVFNRLRIREFCLEKMSRPPKKYLNTPLLPTQKKKIPNYVPDNDRRVCSVRKPNLTWQFEKTNLVHAYVLRWNPGRSTTTTGISHYNNVVV